MGFRNVSFSQSTLDELLLLENELLGSGVVKVNSTNYGVCRHDPNFPLRSKSVAGQELLQTRERLQTTLRSYFEQGNRSLPRWMKHLAFPRNQVPRAGEPWFHGGRDRLHTASDDDPTPAKYVEGQFELLFKKSGDKRPSTFELSRAAFGLANDLRRIANSDIAVAGSLLIHSLAKESLENRLKIATANGMEVGELQQLLRVPDETSSDEEAKILANLLFQGDLSGASPESVRLQDALRETVACTKETYPVIEQERNGPLNAGTNYPVR